MPLKFYMKKW